MKKDLTELVFILDRSGSMHGMEADTVGGFNSMLARQKAQDGDVLVSTVLFDNDTKVLHDRVPLEKIADMTVQDFTVGGCTALLDALGGAIHHIGLIHKYARPEDVPAHTIFVIMTDGMENASRMYTSEKVKKMINREQKEYGWEFIFLASNIDAVETAGHYGIDARHSVNYHNDARGAAISYESISNAICSVRAGKLSEDWKAEAEADFESR